ncbi:hypothetical protein RchiOBHm_Chr5g0029431 [Rosa chinensis]|uniref:Uncharacterized protein n=1 Tax=Rosa chinensis TaxID=74649 RepID=A0A2P6Q9M8_ROSCH|nr:hypothetical protein RchiOBHm_Chr5g0029431 [Rosa chinensis]
MWRMLRRGYHRLQLCNFYISKFQSHVEHLLCQVRSQESYTRGIIILDNKRNLEKLSNFLESPDRIIISSRGRYILCQLLLFD